MNKVSPDRIRLSVAEAQELAEASLRGIGYDAEEARIIADHVVDAALCGYEYSGLPKILNVAEDWRFKEPRGPLKVLRETPVSTLYDGGTTSACSRSIDARKRPSRRPGHRASDWSGSPIAG